MASNNDNVVKVKQIVSSDGVSHDIAAKSLLTTDGTEVTKEDIYSAIGAKEDSSNKTTSIVDSNLSDTKFPSEKATATYVQGKTSPLETDVAAIKGKIPTQASTTNQLADKDFVNSSINSVAAYYITKNAAGDPFATKAELNAATTYYSGGQTRVPTKNDYCLVNADETHDNAAVRYLYTTQWEYQYKVNDTPFTSAQLAAINSGITSTLVGDISSNSSARHTHSNKSLLDSYNQTNTDLSDAVSKKHEHSNKSILDNTTASYTTADQTKLGGIEAGAQVNPTSLPANGGNSDTVDNKHASDFVKYGGNQSGIGSNSPVTGAQDWATAANLPNGNALVYNSSGKEYSMLFSLHPTNRNYGSILRWGYEDKYLYITRKEGNVWKDSTDWEKISAGYADSAGTAGSANSVAWSNVSGKPSFATVATSGSYTDLSNKPTIPSKTSQLTNDSGFITGVAWGDVTDKPSFATVATSGSYNDLSNKPSIPSKTSDLTNDSGYITSSGHSASSGYLTYQLYLAHETAASVGWYKIATITFSTWSQHRAQFIVHNAYGSDYGSMTCSISVSYDSSTLNTNSKVLQILSGRNDTDKLCYVFNDSDKSVTFYLYKNRYEHPCVVLLETENITWESGSLGENKVVSITPTGYADYLLSYLPLTGGNVTGHIYMTGATSSSTSNTSQIVFGTSSDNHVAISSNPDTIVINPATDSTTGQIVMTVGSSPNISVNGVDVSLAGHTHNYLPLDGGTLTGKLTLSSNGLSTNASDGYDVDSHGNLIHKDTNTGHYFHLDNSDSTKQLKYYWETGILNVPDGLTVGGTAVSLDGHTHTKSQITDFPSSLPASDVYDWAKASTKPSYTHDEIGAGDLTIGDGANELYWRTNDSWRSGVYYHTTGNEAVVFANTNSSTSWIFATTDPSSRLDWNTGLTSAVSMQIKNKCVAINKHIASGTTPSYNLDVNGNGRFSDTLTLEKNSVATTLGSENSGFFHIITRNSSGSPIPTYFGQGVSVDGNISLYGTDYYFHSDGNLNANLIKINNKMLMQYNSSEDCIDFVFA